ncbi:hypothetical protein [Lacihabitans soyangensis]|jgi:GTP-dependent phosphoenolpyruvate carboxykinase|uniref:Uncharacterized protein n=1 Tax=Lacihabitans soyangensis TaxID=869394 RepID=A0AAE3H5G9_9BACT|nr:hypothetical protein [Lacihabitans soyangensis]MCP9764356.1 hypothetical protein [Lacihabitans soyangensis]
MVKESSVLNEISNFIAGMNPEKVINFKASDSSQDRLEFLLSKQKKESLLEEEKTELEHYLIINRIVGLAKARALKML